MIAITLVLLGVLGVGLLAVRYGADSRPVERGVGPHRPNLL
jgi:hypothetical protein